MAEFKFTTFDRRSGRLSKAPEVTIQSKGVFSLNLSAYELLKRPEAVELLYDAERRVIGFRGVPPETPHAYPVKGVGKAGALTNFMVTGKSFLLYFDVPFGVPEKREVKMVEDVLVLDLTLPARLARSNRDVGNDKAASVADNSKTGNGTSNGVRVPASPTVKDPDGW